MESKSQVLLGSHVEPVPARVVRTARGYEIRCAEHGHLIGIIDEQGRYVTKCRGRDFVSVEVPRAN